MDKTITATIIRKNKSNTLNLAGKPSFWMIRAYCNGENRNVRKFVNFSE